MKQPSLQLSRTESAQMSRINGEVLQTTKATEDAVLQSLPSARRAPKEIHRRPGILVAAAFACLLGVLAALSFSRGLGLTPIWLFPTPVTLPGEGPKAVHATKPAPIDREEIEVKQIQEKIDEILEQTKSLLQSPMVKRIGKRLLEDKLASLIDVKNSRPVELMDDATLQNLTLEVAALKASTMYMVASAGVSIQIKGLKNYLAKVFGSTELRDILLAHIFVPTTEVQMGTFQIPKQYTEEEKMSFLSSEEESYEEADTKRKALFLDILGSVVDRVKEGKTRKSVSARVHKLNIAGQALQTAVSEALQFLDESRKVFSWTDRKCLTSFQALRDLLEASAEAAMDEVQVWTRISKGEEPVTVRDRQRYHDNITVARICFDNLVRTGKHSPLPRLLVELLNFSTSLQSSALKGFETLRTRYINWANVLMQVLSDDTTSSSPPSIRSFDFRGLLWRSFAQNWQLRSKEERQLIQQTNRCILKASNADLEFAAALVRAQNDSRPLMMDLPDNWH